MAELTPEQTQIQNLTAQLLEETEQLQQAITAAGDVDAEVIAAADALMQTTANLDACVKAMAELITTPQEARMGQDVA